MRRPVILLPPDLETFVGKRGPVPHLTSQRVYADAIFRAGGLPLIPSPTEDAFALDALTALADGLVLPGGGFDIDPALYGEVKRPSCGELKPERTAFERALYLRFFDENKPILGICGGMQLINVMRGGSLWQDTKSERPDAARDDIEHQQAGAKSEPAHDVKLVNGTRLAKLLAAHTSDRLPVNSTHHQSVKAVGQGLVVSATAPDGVIEAIELEGDRFCLGVQWHPEAMPQPAQLAIYEALVAAARG